MITKGYKTSIGLDELEAHREKRKTAHQETPVEVPVQEVREPAIDIMEEAGYTLILADLPGITKKDVRLALKDEILIIRAARDEKRYYKEVLLPGLNYRNQLKFSCSNGILEVKAAA
jgi:HSP20 family molecular chaperone IbpA